MGCGQGNEKELAQSHLPTIVTSGVDNMTLQSGNSSIHQEPLQVDP